jgi:hypothetical protein
MQGAVVSDLSMNPKRRLRAWMTGWMKPRVAPSFLATMLL